MKKPLSTIKEVIHTLTFSLQIILFSSYAFFKYFSKFLYPLTFPANFFYYLSRKIEVKPKNNISNLEIITLAINSMRAKKARTIITIGGMTIGISSIVFLVSIGYGLQELVISRVTRLEEMKQIDISAQPGAKIKIDDKSINTIKEIPHVESILPLISVVGKVNYNKSLTDLAVYGVTSDYLNTSAIKPYIGKLFDSNELSTIDSHDTDKNNKKTPVKTDGELISRVALTLKNGQWIRIKKEAKDKSTIVGYFQRVSDGSEFGQLIWGEYYKGTDELNDLALDQDGNKLSQWIKVKVPVWNKEGTNYTPILDSSGNTLLKEGYFPANTIEFEEVTSQKADSVTSSSNLKAENIDPETLEIIGMDNLVTRDNTIPISDNYIGEAVVNKSMIKLLSIDEARAVGTEIKMSFITTNELSDGTNQRLHSEEAVYKIIGVTPDESAPIIYVPFTDLRSIGITKYSQAKVIVSQQENLQNVRNQIEVLGFSTRSVVDTVIQINSLFSTIRLILALLGIVALAVAALGMFNTLTVSLLERTREVGLMKAMGMKSSEIKDLFLAESLLMGSLGGIFGLILGFLLGKLLELIISIFSIYKGIGYINITYIPITFIIVIIVLSLFVGIFTGFFPARRATRISALNALRYE